MRVVTSLHNKIVPALAGLVRVARVYLPIPGLRNISPCLTYTVTQSYHEKKTSSVHALAELFCCRHHRQCSRVLELFGVVNSIRLSDI